MINKVKVWNDTPKQGSLSHQSEHGRSKDLTNQNESASILLTKRDKNESKDLTSDNKVNVRI